MKHVSTQTSKMVGVARCTTMAAETEQVIDPDIPQDPELQVSPDHMIQNCRSVQII